MRTAYRALFRCGQCAPARIVTIRPDRCREVGPAGHAPRRAAGPDGGRGAAQSHVRGKTRIVLIHKTPFPIKHDCYCLATLRRDLGRYASGMRAKRTRSTGPCIRFAARPAPSHEMVARACGRPAAWPCGSRTAWPWGCPQRSAGFGRTVGTSSIAPEP